MQYLVFNLCSVAVIVVVVVVVVLNYKDAKKGIL